MTMEHFFVWINQNVCLSLAAVRVTKPLSLSGKMLSSNLSEFHGRCQGRQISQPSWEDDMALRVIKHLILSGKVVVPNLSAFHRRFKGHQTSQPSMEDDKALTAASRDKTGQVMI